VCEARRISREPRYSGAGADPILSGINFVGPIARTLGFDGKSRQRRSGQASEYRAIYVGSSSRNKNFISALIVLLASRRRGHRHDIIFVKAFRGAAGSGIFVLARFCSVLMRLLRVGIHIRCSETGFLKQTVYEALSKAQFVVIPYFREGIPRIIGECFYFGAEPLVWKHLSFAECEVGELLPRYGIRSLIAALAEARNPSIDEDTRYRRLAFIEPFERLRALAERYDLDCSDPDDALAVAFYERLTRDSVKSA